MVSSAFLLTTSRSTHIQLDVNVYRAGFDKLVVDKTLFAQIPKLENRP